MWGRTNLQSYIMKKLILLFIAATVAFGSIAAEELRLSGRVKEATGKTDLTQARIILYDSLGNVRDSIQANQGLTYHYGQLDTMSYFSFIVPKVDSTHVFDVVCDGYLPETVSYRLDNIGRREQSRTIPTIYLERAPRLLKEVTVTTSKIKFYNKGDTVVYNADAFQLAEGSMLDALIAQLPGVELNSDGQIKVNGEFVESLLLNGKEFMDGNNNVMLENIAAYTVKDVQVYEGESAQAKRTNDKSAPKLLTMDVKLKKEYNMGWILNAQGGYGTEDRYTGRLFASWFNTTTRLTLVGNINNLNDNRQPGKNDTWTPEAMPTGTKEHRMAGFDYYYENPENTRQANGNLLFSQTINNSLRTLSRTNFLPGGDTYDNSFSDSRNSETGVQTRHSAYARFTNSAVGLSLGGSYANHKNANSDLSATFTEEQDGMTREILDALYSSGSPELLEKVINRSKTRTDGRSRQLNGYISPYFTFKIPKTEDNIYVNLQASYQSDKQHLWNEYNINFGNNATEAIKRRQYVDNTPNHTLSFRGTATYRTSLKKCYLSIDYSYSYSDKIKDSYMYALDRLNDMGIYGIVPDNYLDSFDPANSYTSREIENRHSLNPFVSYRHQFGDTSMLEIRVSPEISLVHRNLDYWRNDHTYRLSKTNGMLNIASIWSGMIEYQFNPKIEGRWPKYRNSIRYSYRITPTLPNMVDMVDVVDDTNPLNIYYGNPALKISNAHRHLMRWNYSPHSHTFVNTFYISYSHTDNALTRGYTYELSTGVRHNRMYNVNGQNTAAVTNSLNWQFGSTKQFTLSSETDFNTSRYVDMIGINMDAPQKTHIRNTTVSEKLNFGWKVGNQTLLLRSDYTNRHTTSTQTDFKTINAYHLNYGISGIFKLPAGFGASTDFICYTRRGYGSKELDTTDPVWNARVTYCPPGHSRWVFMIDAFDMLHKLSNVKYAVSGSGRTVSYTNTIPRYVLFSIQYRMTIQPRKK